MTAAVCDQQLMVIGAVVYNSYSAHLFTAQTATHAVSMLKSREQNRITSYGLWSGKSEAEVPIIEDCTRSIVLLKLTTDRHKASCSLSATAELLVVFCVMYHLHYFFASASQVIT